MEEKTFVRYYSAPVKINENFDCEVCEDSDADFYSVYGVCKDGLSTWIADFHIKDLAEDYANKCNLSLSHQ